MRLELPASDGQRHVGEPLVVEERPEVVRQSTLRHFELHHVALTADVDAIRYHWHFAEYRQLVFG